MPDSVSTGSNSAIFRALRRVGQVIRDGWLMLGLTLLLFLAAETLYRTQARIRGVARPGEDDAMVRPEPPTAKDPWRADFNRAGESRTNRFDTYRTYWSNPLSSKYKNVDSAGRRVTIQGPFDPATSRRVFMLGGSTMFGINARDSTTIPSLVAARLKAKGLSNIEVINLAQGGYTLMQGTITFLLELSRSRPPEVAVFFDGQNDIMYAGSTGIPGENPIQPRIQRLLDLGRRSAPEELLGLGRHSELIQRLLTIGATAPKRPSKPEAVCSPLAEYFDQVTRSIQAMADSRGVKAIFIQQPMHVTTKKRLTEFERTLPVVPWRARCAASIDSAMSAARDRQYVSFASLFDSDTADVYTDQFAHLTEHGHEVVADRIADLVADALARTEH